MTSSEILSDEALRQHEFPVAREKIFLAHAGVAPLPRRVADAVRDYAELCTQGDQETLLPAQQMQHSRALAARLLNARPDEIAFVGPTSLALSFIAAGLPWRKNDNVLIYFDDYPANVYPWMALAERGVEVRFLSTSEPGRLRPLEVIGQVDEQTRLVALASCHFVSGYRIDLNAIGQALHERNILFCVDAIQTLGAFPTTVEHIDFPRGRRAQVAARPVRRRHSLRAKRASGQFASRGLRLAQRTLPQLRRSRATRLPPRRSPLRSRHPKPSRPRRAARGDGTAVGNGHRQHCRRIVAKARAAGSRAEEQRLLRAACRRAARQRQRH